MSGGGLYLPQRQTLWTFTQNGVDGWQPWRKPDGASLITLEGVGAGGSGGGGTSGAAGSARRGGGGGASGAFTRVMIPAELVGDTLYIRPGVGAPGGAASVAGVDGGDTWITHYVGNAAAIPAMTYLIAKGGTYHVNGGSAGAASLVTECMLAGMGIFSSTTGDDGTTAGANTGAAGGIKANYGFFRAPFCGGTGGAGTGTDNANYAGGLISGVAPSLFTDIPGGIAGGGNGNGGLRLERPMVHTGGTGGGSNGAAGTGGRGGNGAPGCGGGGGGAGVTGGAGGDGGAGRVWIHVIFS